MMEQPTLLVDAKLAKQNWLAAWMVSYIYYTFIYSHQGQNKSAFVGPVVTLAASSM